MALRVKRRKYLRMRNKTHIYKGSRDGKTFNTNNERKKMDNVRGRYAIDTNLLHNSLSRANFSFCDNLKMVNSGSFPSTGLPGSPRRLPTLY